MEQTNLIEFLNSKYKTEVYQNVDKDTIIEVYMDRRTDSISDYISKNMEIIYPNHILYDDKVYTVNEIYNSEIEFVLVKIKNN